MRLIYLVNVQPHLLSPTYSVILLPILVFYFNALNVSVSFEKRMFFSWMFLYLCFYVVHVFCIMFLAV